MDGTKVQMAFSPNGLTEQMIDVLLVEMDAATTEVRPTSALVDGTAAERRSRRIERRATGRAVARILAAGRVVRVVVLVAPNAAVRAVFGDEAA